MYSQDDAREYKTRFDRDGFVTIPQFVSAAVLDLVRSELERYIRDVAPGLPAEDCFYETKGDPGSLKQMQRMMENDAWFREFFTGERFIGLAENLLATAVIAKNVEYFCKPPGIGHATPPHQDGYYFMLEANEALTMWLALDEINEENGCLRYVRGSHRKGMRPHEKSHVLGFSQGITDYGPCDARAEALMLSRPGDLHVHHSMLVHRAGANTSPKPRRALALVCYSSLARQDAEQSAAYQKSLTAELTRAGKI